MRLAAMAILWAMIGPLGGAAAADKPNVLFILVDDLGWTDLGCFGSSFYETPNIDALAASGAKLTNAYAACPVCSPTRASIMTGKYPARMATTDYFGAAQPERWRRNTPLLPAPYVERLAAEETSLAEAMRSAGYKTFFAGKWHLGPQGSWPEDHGFDVNRGGCQWGHPKGGKRFFSPYKNPRLEDGPPGEHLTARLANETSTFIEQHAGEPFFAYLSFYTVHTPLMAPKADVTKYEAKRAALGEDVDRFVPERKRKARQDQSHATYAAMVASLDRAVGSVLDTIERLGLSEKTIVVFTSDNGGLSTSEGSPTSNLPLRAGKGWMYEGGIREPTIVRWPGVAAAGIECDAVVTSTDYYPSLLEMTGQPPAPQQHLDGKSFAAALRGEKYERGPVYWHYPHYGNQGGAPAAAVRDGDWKLVEWYDDTIELFNLADDIGEHHDLAADRPAKVEQLKRQLDAWRASVGARMPTPNPKYRAPAVNVR